jgi:hypothetical protein
MSGEAQLPAPGEPFQQSRTQAMMQVRSLSRTPTLQSNSVPDPLHYILAFESGSLFYYGSGSHPFFKPTTVVTNYFPILLNKIRNLHGES